MPTKFKKLLKLFLFLFILLFLGAFTVQKTYAQVPSIPNPPDIVSSTTPDNAWVSTLVDPVYLRIKDGGPVGSYPATYHWNQFQVYKDDGDGLFDELVDTLIQEDSVGHLPMSEANYPPGGEVQSSTWLAGEVTGQRFFWRARLNNWGSDWASAPAGSMSGWSTEWAFTVDNDPPSSTINQPACASPANLTSLTGTASDAHSGVFGTAVSIQRDSDGLWWDWTSSSWGGSQQWDYASGTTSWTIDTSGVTWTPGEEYTVFSSAEDNAITVFNREDPPNTVDFEIGTCDLGVTSVVTPYSDPSDPAEGGVGVTADITVENIGTADINTPFEVSFCWDVSSCVATTLAPQIIPSLEEGDSALVSFTFTAPSVSSPTMFTIRVVVDSGSAVVESDETNNEKAADYWVESAPYTPWYETAGGDVGSLEKIKVPTPGVVANAEYLVIANKAIDTNFTSAKDWLVEDYDSSGGINTGIDSSVPYTELWEKFGEGKATSFTCSPCNRTALPDDGVFVFNGDFVWQEAVPTALAGGPTVLFINGDLTFNTDFNMDTAGSNKLVVLIVKGDVSLEISVSNLDAFVVAKGDFDTGETVIPPPRYGNHVGREGDIVLDTEGLALISFEELNVRGLNLARCLNHNCTRRNITTVDNNNAGRYSSLALGDDGNPRIVYRGDGKVKLARCLDTECTDRNIVTVDPIGPPFFNAGQSIPLALENIGDGNPSNDYPALVYKSAGQLKYARCLNLDCEDPQITVLETNSTRLHSSLAIGNDGFARISFMDSGPSLGYIRCLNANCNSRNRVIISGPNSGWYNSITLGDDGLARLTHWRRGPSDMVEYVRCLDDNCGNRIISAVESGLTYFYSANDLTLANLGNGDPGDDEARVVYWDDGGDPNVKYARCLNPDCTNSPTTTSSPVSSSSSSTSIFTSSLLNPPVVAPVTITSESVLVTKTPSTVDAVTTIPVDTNIRSYSSADITLHSNGRPRIIYKNWALGDLIYARCLDQNCEVQRITTIDGQTVDDDCPECQLTVNGGVVAFGRVNLARDLGISDDTDPSEIFNYNAAILYYFARRVPGQKSLLGEQNTFFEESPP